MTGTRQIVLIAAMCVALFCQSFASGVENRIATGAAADSAANRNTEAATRYGGYGAFALAVLTALSSRIPGLHDLVTKLGGANTIGRVIDDGAKLVERRGADPSAMIGLFRLAVEKGAASNPEVMSLLGRLNLHLGDSPPVLPPGDPPSREECLAQLVRRIELDAAARISGETLPTIIPFPRPV